MIYLRFYHRPLLLGPLAHPAIDVADVGVSRSAQLPSHLRRSILCVANQEHGLVIGFGYFAQALAQLAHRQQACARSNAKGMLVRLSDINHDGA